MKRATAFWLVPILCLLMLCSCDKSPEEQWQEQYDLGIRYLSEGNYEEAIIAFTAAIEIDPKQPETYIRLADIYITLGDVEKALDILELGENNAGPNELIQSNIDDILYGNPLVITSVTYDYELVGDVNGTPTIISLQYNCPDQKTYYLSLELKKGGEYVCDLGYDNSYQEVSGRDSIDVETRLVLFDAGAEEFEIVASLFELVPDPEYGEVYSAIFNTSYKFNDSFSGIGIPDVPKYPEIAYRAGEIVLNNITISGIIKNTTDIYGSYLNCLNQYAAYTSYDTRGSNAYVLQLDEPILLSDGNRIDYTFISFPVLSANSDSRGESEKIRSFVQNNLNKQVTISGYLAQNPPGISGIVLVSNTLDPDDFWYEFKLPYNISIQSIM